MDERSGDVGLAAVEAALARLFPGGAPALRVEEVVEQAGLLLRLLGVAPEVWEERLSVRTVRYYRSKGIVSAPAGDGPNARYGRRHVLEAAAARLAGHLHHLSLADAAERIAALDDAGLGALLGELVTKEREDHLPRPLPGSGVAPSARDDTGGKDGNPGVEATPGVALRLPHGALLVLPYGHPALRGASPERVGRAVAVALEGAGE
ncbi:MAG TPA: hypothetical protein VHG28_16705 [Longimicrobiaceae bacterium]|nr:hypothetical protein [Longimicrobiaceae bacterium]